MPATGAATPPTFNYTVTDTTKPVWFFCATGTHCKSGMVFAVNPTANQTFVAFQATAKGQSSPSSGSSSNVSSGSGSTSSASTSPTANNDGGYGYGSGGGAAGRASIGFGAAAGALVLGALAAI